MKKNIENRWLHMANVAWITALLFLNVKGSTVAAQEITVDAENKARALVEQMTLEEKVSYISGYTSFSLRAIPRLGIPQVLLADGPQGLRNHSDHSTLFPAGILTAATWNRSLQYQLGVALGQDARARGVSILLGPGVNIYRTPLCGRNYEYFGEDPYLTSEVAKQYILGVQSQGVIATIKHFCANNQEWNRHHVSSDVDERTLNEIYFPAFRKAVQEAHVGAVMNSYNLLNGVHATENRWLNIDVLRKQWGFRGILMSDWTSVYSTVNAANGGLDLEMPKGKFMNLENVKAAMENGRITEKTIDLKVQHILQTLFAHGVFDREQKDSTILFDNPFSRQTALQLAREGIVLLKNENGILPLKGVTAVVGTNANIITTGGGSGFVSPFSSTAVSEALRKARKNTILLTDDVIYEDVTKQIFTDELCSRQGFVAEYFKNQNMEGTPDTVFVENKIDHNWGSKAPMSGFPSDHFSVRWSAFYKPDRDSYLRISMGGDDGYRIFIDDKQVMGDWGNHAYSNREKAIRVEKGKTYRLRIEYFDNISDAAIRCDITRLDEAKLMNGVRKADNVVYCTGFNSDVEGEGFDRPFGIPSYQKILMKRIAETNSNLVVVLNAGGGVDMSDWHGVAKGILMAWHPGQEGGTAIAEILTGKISPSGRLPISIESRLEDNICYANYYENTKQKECKTVEYKEGIFTGYRGYDKTGVKPLYPFGFGLSYSTFSYSNLRTETVNDTVWVRLEVKNTGKMAAASIVQVYVGDVEASVPRPQKELKGFEKVFLGKGETREVSIPLSKDAFAFYDDEKHDFVIEPGYFTISVGMSSDDMQLSTKIKL